MKRYSVRKFTVLLMTIGLVMSCASSRSGTEELTTDDEELKSVVRNAFQLERELSGDAVKSREDVLSVFRKGFQPELAKRLADYYWLESPDGTGILRGSEPLFLPPDGITIESKSAKQVKATVTYSANTAGPMSWAAHSLSVLLKPEGELWKIAELVTDSPDPAAE